MEGEDRFPKFECVISNTQEDYDSDIGEFFLRMQYLEDDLGMLMFVDNGWRKNYENMLKYLSDMLTSIIFSRELPSANFLSGLLPDKASEEDIVEVLLRSKDESPSILLRASARARELVSWYIRVARISRFSKNFPQDGIIGIMNMRSVLFHRAIEKSKE